MKKWELRLRKYRDRVAMPLRAKYFSAERTLPPAQEWRKTKNVSPGLLADLILGADTAIDKSTVLLIDTREEMDFFEETIWLGLPKPTINIPQERIFDLVYWDKRGPCCLKKSVLIYIFHSFWGLSGGSCIH